MTRKLYYNMTITPVSIVAAVVIGGLEILNFGCDQLYSNLRSTGASVRPSQSS
jgi:high-affinity nickel permease